MRYRYIGTTGCGLLHVFAAEMSHDVVVFDHLAGSWVENSHDLPRFVVEGDTLHDLDTGTVHDLLPVGV